MVPITDLNIEGLQSFSGDKMSTVIRIQIKKCLMMIYVIRIKDNDV